MKKALSYFAGVGALVAPFVAFGQLQEGQLPTYSPLQNLTTVENVLSIIQRIANWIGGFLMALAVIMILVSAFYFLTAGGDPEKLKSGRNYLIYALVGVAVALVAFALPLVVRPLLNA